MLCLRGELTAVPSFEFALRERVSSLAAFRHACYGRVRSVERLKDPASTLALVSDATPGVRLSDLLAFAKTRARHVRHRRRAVPAAAARAGGGDAARARAGCRPTARSRPNVSSSRPRRASCSSSTRWDRRSSSCGTRQSRYWKELRIALPRSAGPAKFDQRADVTQLGVTALSLILGRPLTDDESPARLGDVVASAWAVSSEGGLEPLPAGLRAWLTSALQLDPRHAFRSAVEAQAELERVLGESDYLAAPATLETLLAAYLASLEPIAPPAADAAVQPPSTPVVTTAGHAADIDRGASRSPVTRQRDGRGTSWRQPGRAVRRSTTAAPPPARERSPLWMHRANGGGLQPRPSCSSRWPEPAWRQRADT